MFSPGHRDHSDFSTPSAWGFVARTLGTRGAISFPLSFSLRFWGTSWVGPFEVRVGHLNTLTSSKPC